MAFAAGSGVSQSSEINVTPLIDVLLVLLIIFMAISPAMPRGLGSSIPQGKAEAGPAPVVVRVLAGEPARYQIGREDVSYEALPMRLSALFAVRQDRTIFVEADRNLEYREVAAVVSEARAAAAGAVVFGELRP
jgi:biopolymer transport protein ExbD